MNIIELTKIIWFMVLSGLGTMVLYATLATLCEQIFGYVRISKKDLIALKSITDVMLKQMEETENSVSDKETEEDDSNEE